MLAALALALALGSALATNVAFSFKQRGAVLAPAARGRHPLRSAIDLFRSRADPDLGARQARLRRRGLLLGVAASVLFGVSDIALDG